MGTNRIEAVLKHSKARSGARLLLIVLAHRADDASGECFPSVTRLAADCGLNRRQTMHWINELVEQGEIERIRTAGLPNRYRIATRAADCTSAEDRTSAAERTGPVQSTAPDPCSALHPEHQLTDKNTKKTERGGKPAKAEVQVELPEALDRDPFPTVWGEWLAYRRERRLTCTARTLRRQLDTLAGFGLDGALAAVDASITNGWQGIFPPKPEALAKARAEHAGNLLPHRNPTEADLAFLREDAAQ